MKNPKPIQGNPKILIPPHGMQDKYPLEEMIEILWVNSVEFQYKFLLKEVEKYYAENTIGLSTWIKNAENILQEEKEKSIINGFAPLVILLPEIE